MRVAFYAPIKPPHHPIPSGDRLIAQNLMEMLELNGHHVELASSFIAYSKKNADHILKQKKMSAQEEGLRVISNLKSTAKPPDVWLTYHPYCKAPDWIGPKVAGELAIPYVTLEAARTGQEGWEAWREEAQKGIRAADLHLVMKPTDQAYLEKLLGGNQTLAPLPPFFNPCHRVSSPIILPFKNQLPVVVTIGMMRPGKKLENYRYLAQTLKQVHEGFNLLAIGGGPAESEVRDLLSFLPGNRLHMTGTLTPENVQAHLAASDVFLWPGWREPIGMVYLEAQNQGLPVAAFESMGVPLVVRDGSSGLLAREGDTAELASYLTRFLRDREQRKEFGKNAIETVRGRHSLKAAASILDAHLKRLVYP